MEAEAIKPAFVVLKGCENVAPGEGLGVVCICAFETCLNECSFWLCEERCRGGVVVDEEIREGGDDNCKKSLLIHSLAPVTNCFFQTHKYENPSPPIIMPNTFHKPNSIRKNTTKRTSQRSRREK